MTDEWKESEDVYNKSIDRVDLKIILISNWTIKNKDCFYKALIRVIFKFERNLFQFAEDFSIH